MRSALKAHLAHFVLQAAALLAALWTVVRAQALFIRYRRQLSAAESILLYPEGGFAHALIGPDWQRRRMNGQRHFTIFAYSPDRHNPYLADLWGPEVFAYLPAAIRVGGAHAWQRGWTVAAFNVLKAELRLLLPGREVIDIFDFIRSAQSCWPSSALSNGVPWQIPYFHIIRETPFTSPVYLPQPVRQRCRNALGTIPGLNRICNLYVRFKGINSTDATTANRSGSDIACYFSTVRLLISRGYRVMLTGEGLVPDDAKQEFGSFFVDWRDFDLPRDLYMVYVGTESDLHIGQNAGGSAYHHVNGIPSVMVNVFPIGESMPKATILYKSLKRADGTFLTPQECFAEHCFDYECRHLRVRPNTAAEIEAAVCDFLDNGLAQQSPYGHTLADLGIPENNSYLSPSNGRISPVWVNLLHAQSPRGDSCDGSRH